MEVQLEFNLVVYDQLKTAVGGSGAPKEHIYSHTAAISNLCLQELGN